MKKVTIVEQQDADGNFIMVKINDRLEKCWAYVPGNRYYNKFRAIRNALMYVKEMDVKPQTKILRQYETAN